MSKLNIGHKCESPDAIISNYSHPETQDNQKTLKKKNKLTLQPNTKTFVLQFWLIEWATQTNICFS
jgi:hypothetical protein